MLKKSLLMMTLLQLQIIFILSTNTAKGAPPDATYNVSYIEALYLRVFLQVPNPLQGTAWKLSLPNPIKQGVIVIYYKDPAANTGAYNGNSEQLKKSKDAEDFFIDQMEKKVKILAKDIGIEGYKLQFKKTHDFAVKVET